jgi:hypothetical protein
VAVSPIAVAAQRVIGGDLDQDDLDAIGSISAARGVTRQVNENARSPAVTCGRSNLCFLELSCAEQAYLAVPRHP